MRKKDNEGYGCIHFAAMKGNEDIIQFFVETGGKIEEKSELGLSCFHIAAQFNQVRMLAFLRDQFNISVSVQDYRDSTPLH